MARLPRRRKPRTRTGRPGSTWGSSTRTPPRGRRGKGCWCRGGRSGRSAASTCATARPGPGLPPPRPQAGAAGVAAVAAAPPQRSGRPRAGTRGGSARPSTRPPGPLWTWAVATAGRDADRPGIRAASCSLAAGRSARQAAAGLADRAPDVGALRDKAEAAGITVKVIDERGTSSTCPSCSRRVPKPAGRVFRCPHCGHGGHRDLVAAANIAARGGGPIPAYRRQQGSRTAAPGGTSQVPACRDVTPGAGPHHGQHATGPLAGTGPPRTPRRWTGSRSPNPRGARKNATPDELTSRCTKSRAPSFAEEHA